MPSYGAEKTRAFLLFYALVNYKKINKNRGVDILSGGLKYA